ncbi:unnamed protein product [Durusdinium trenchii]|uniref:Chloride channel protein n=1 Tax=Durusdinium trenchii TaxID=1381693 RepID=A0ABP0LDL6_9DINO
MSTSMSLLSAGTDDLRRPLSTQESGEISWDPSRYHRSTRRMVYDFLHPGEEELLRFYSLRFCRLADAHLWLLPVLIGVNLLQVLILLMVLHWNLDYDFWELRILVLVLTATLFTAEVLLRVWACVEEHPALALQPNLSRIRFSLMPLNSLDVATSGLLWVFALMVTQRHEVNHMEVFFRLGLLISMASGGAMRSRSRSWRSKSSAASLHPEKIVEYDFQADRWKTSVSFRPGGMKRRGSIFENLPQEDAFGFDPESGRKFRLLLIISAALSSITSFAVDRGAGVLQGMTKELLLVVEDFMGFSSKILHFWVIFFCNGALLWSAYALVRFSPEAAGSGLPEVKCILSGIELSNFLQPRVLAAKSLGLTLVLGASMPVGKEGPFVHIASCISAILLELERCFANVSLDRQEVLLAAVAVGVGATFSAPVGGVLFALELMMPRLYDTSSYSACFFASTFGTFVFMCLNMLFSGSGQLKPLFNSDITAEQGPTLEAEILFIILCLITGALSGALASAFVLCHRRAVGAMNALRGLAPLFGETKAGQSVPRDLVIFLCAGGIGAMLQAGAGSKLLTLGTGPFLSCIFSTQAHLTNPELATLGGLMILFLTKTSFTVMALSMPVPAGVVAPSLMLGGIFGRLVAAMLPQNCIEYLAPDGDFGQYIARLAIVGATCFCGAVCRVNSVVVTVFELIAVPRLILPLTLATIVSNFCANSVGPSIFDSILLMKKIPAMPTLRASARALQSVRKILDPTMMSLCLPRRAQRTDFTRLHFIKKSREDEGRSVPRMIPIVDEVKTGGEPRLVLLGAVTWEDLDALQVAGGEDMLVSAAKLGKILQDPLRINPHISLKKAYIESQSVPRKGPMMVVEDGFLVGILPHDDLVRSGAEAAKRGS